MNSKDEVIRLTDITKNYKVGTEVVRALRSISLTVYRNEYVALMGPSGSGKSTLMNILGCLDSPSSGQYILNGTDVSSMSDSNLAMIRNKEIGFVFQTFNLLPRATALDNVALPLVYAGIGKNKRNERALEVLRSVDLGDRTSHRPNELSGGQRQRVAIARALVNSPSIILADEPTGNLDSKISIDIMGLFEEIHKAGNTIIIVTHEESIALHAHRIIRLIDGNVASDELNHNITTYQKAMLEYSNEKNDVKIYTRTGDQGETSLLGGTRVPKFHKRVAAYGSVDELNSYIGLLRDLIPVSETQKFLVQVQNNLFTIQTLLAAESEKAASKLPALSSADITTIEKEIDCINTGLSKLETFILPGGHTTVSFCHIARCICRKTERIVTEMATHHSLDMSIIKYLNRLSDYLFVLARKTAKDNHAEELSWNAGDRNSKPE